jgi:predicted amidohydrolase
MRIAMIQMDVAIGQPDVNIDRLLDKLLEAVQQSPKPDVIICPEMWNTGYALAELDELADVDGMRTKNIISAFCRKHAVNVIAGSVAVKNTEQDCAYNQTYVFNRDGEVISQYAKIHLFQLMDEHHFLQPGESVSHCDLDGVDAGLMICYDIRFPELARKLALEGAKVLFVSAQWPNPRLQHWRTLLQARAIENQLYVVACNRVGESAGTSFFGHSMVIDPWGEVLVEGSESEQLLSAELDINVVTQIRNKIPVFEDRRPTLY